MFYFCHEQFLSFGVTYFTNYFAYMKHFPPFLVFVVNYKYGICPCGFALGIANTLAFENVIIGLTWLTFISEALAANLTLWKSDFKHGERVNFEPCKTSSYFIFSPRWNILVTNCSTSSLRTKYSQRHIASR